MAEIIIKAESGYALRTVMVELLFGKLLSVRNDPPSAAADGVKVESRIVTTEEKATGEDANAATVPQADAGAASEPVASTEAEAQPKRRRGRPKKEISTNANETKAVEAETASEEITPSEPAATEDEPDMFALPGETKASAPTSTATKEEMTKALQALQATEGKGVDAVRKVLADFNCRRVSEVTEAQYADVIAAADKAVAS